MANRILTAEEWTEQDERDRWLDECPEVGFDTFYGNADDCGYDDDA